MEMKIVAAMCNGNRGAGNKRTLPWPVIKEDTDYYLDLVKKRRNPEKKNLQIQGRFTWEFDKSERKSDPHSMQIIISSTYDASNDPYHPIVLPSLEEAVRVAMTPEIQSQVESIWILGGQRLWEDSIMHPMCKRIYLTKIYKDFDSDVFFPPFEDKFVKSSDPEVDGKMREHNGIKFQFRLTTSLKVSCYSLTR